MMTILMVVVVIVSSKFSTETLGYEARIVDDYEGRDLIVYCLSKAKIGFRSGSAGISSEDYVGAYVHWRKI